MIRTVSIWRWQLVFTGSVVAILVMVAAFTPDVLVSGTFVAGLALVVLTTIATLALPWQRLPRSAVAALPLFDALAVGLLTTAWDLRLGLLWVFPVTWLATYFTMPWVFVGVALISACLAVFAEPTGEAADVLLRILTVIIALSFLGVTVRIGAQRSRAARRLLQRRSEQVDRAAERAETNQRRVTQIIDALGVALVVVDGERHILQMNDAYRTLYGRDRFGQALPSAAVEYDRRRGAALPPDRTTLARAARGERLHDESVWLFDSDGRWRALQVSTQAIAGATEQEHIALVVIDDVTELFEAAEERRALAAVVSHELRNPLTAIIGHVDLLREREDLPARVTAQLEVIANAGERMEDLVASTLDASRQAPAEPFGAVDLREVFEAAAASFAPLVEGGGLRLEVDGADTLPIHGDAFRLRQVLDNILGNAVKYTPSGGRLIVRFSSDADGRAQVSIADTGAGIGPDDLPRVFEPYFRTARVVRAGIAGTGLGMGIARDIVTAHDGTIDIESAVGAGTTVTLRFPREQNPSEKQVRS
ncbi:Sensor histidine kinase RcsC [Microbacterium sp. SA39]|nr:Sensor histidine kinase RcsC [Microbacterium sp. SA39]